MDLTNKLISKTYIGVNNNYKISDEYKIFNDAEGNQSNFNISLLSSTNKDAKYTVGDNTVIKLPGNNELSDGRTLIGKTENTFSTCNITTDNTYLKIGNISYPYAELSDNNTLKISNNILTTGGDYKSSVKLTKIVHTVFNPDTYILCDVQSDGKNSSGGETAKPYFRTCDLSNKLYNINDYNTIYLKITTFVQWKTGYKEGNDYLAGNRQPYIVMGYNGLLYKISGFSIKYNSEATGNDYKFTYAKKDGGIANYGWDYNGGPYFNKKNTILNNILPGSYPDNVANIIGNYAQIIGSPKPIKCTESNYYNKKTKVGAIDITIPLAVKPKNNIVTFYSLLTNDDGHHRVHHTFHDPHHWYNWYSLKAEIVGADKIVKDY